MTDHQRIQILHNNACICRIFIVLRGVSGLVISNMTAGTQSCHKRTAALKVQLLSPETLARSNAMVLVVQRVLHRRYAAPASGHKAQSDPAPSPRRTSSTLLRYLGKVQSAGNIGVTNTKLVV
jgi:hypothetical protein